MLKESKSMRLFCDGCEEQYETHEGYSGFLDDHDGSEIVGDALDNDWKHFGSRHYCPNCWWSDEEDENIIHTKDGRSYDDSTGYEIPIFQVGDCMRDKREVEEGVIDGLPYVERIVGNLYVCNNECIPIERQNEYEYPPMNRK